MGPLKGLLDWLTGLLGPGPQAPPWHSLACSADGLRVAAVDSEGLVTVWELPEGRVLMQHRGAIPGLAISPDGQQLVTGDGVVVQVGAQPAVLHTGAFHAHPYFVGDELLSVGWGRVHLGPVAGPPRVRLDDEAPDPSSLLELLRGPGLLALVDPAWNRPWVLDPGAGTWLEVPVGKGPLHDAAWVGDQLALVQEGRVGLVQPRLGPASGLEKVQRHGLQTLAVAGHQGELVTAGLRADDGYELRIGEAEPLLVAGKAPPRPQLLSVPGGVLLETWQGWLFKPDDAEAVLLKLPLGRRGRRPVDLRAGRLRLRDDAVCVATAPPAVYRLADARCLQVLAVPEKAR